MSYKLIQDGKVIGVAQMVRPIPAAREELGSAVPVQGRPVTPRAEVYRAMLYVVDVERQDRPIDLVGSEETYRGAWFTGWRSAWSTEAVDGRPPVTIIEEARLAYTERETLSHDTWWRDGDTIYQGRRLSYQHKVQIVGEDLVVENSSGGKVAFPIRLVRELISDQVDEGRLARLWNEAGPVSRVQKGRTVDERCPCGEGLCGCGAEIKIPTRLVGGLISGDGQGTRLESALALDSELARLWADSGPAARAKIQALVESEEDPDEEGGTGTCCYVGRALDPGHGG